MPFVPVPKDLTKVKTKVAFNLTRRQLICFGGGALVGVPIYIFTRGSIGNDAAAMLMIGLMLPFFLFGIYEKDGQHLEQVLGHIIRAQFIHPPYRPYQTENIYAALERQNQLDKEAANIEQHAKKAGAKSSARGKTASGRKKRHPADARRKTDRR
ncbi:MAG: PrgI family protein [Oscillospiraceae bacterium]|nr:PrgI family protein [Oscillospiraceae bacterium]